MKNLIDFINESNIDNEFLDAWLYYTDGTGFDSEEDMCKFAKKLYPINTPEKIKMLIEAIDEYDLMPGEVCKLLAYTLIANKFNNRNDWYNTIK